MPSCLHFVMMARKFSIAPKSVLSFDTTKYLCRKDIRLTSYGLEAQLELSKTNQFGDKNIILPLFELQDSPLN